MKIWFICNIIWSLINVGEFLFLWRLYRLLTQAKKDGEANHE